MKKDWINIVNGVIQRIICIHEVFKDLIENYSVQQFAYSIIIYISEGFYKNDGLK